MQKWDHDGQNGVKSAPKAQFRNAFFSASSTKISKIKIFFQFYLKGVSIESTGKIGSQYVDNFGLQRLKASLRKLYGTSFRWKLTIFGGPRKNLRSKPLQTIHFLLHHVYTYNPVKFQHDRSILVQTDPKKGFKKVTFCQKMTKKNFWSPVAHSIFNIF